MSIREIKFRGLHAYTSKWCYGGLHNIHSSTANLHYIMNKYHKYPVEARTISQFTGFKDKNGAEIFEGDILSDWYEVDGKQVQSKMQVFWCEEVGAWKLDNSYKQDKSSGYLLSVELADFVYEVTGNIYEKISNHRCNQESGS